MYTYFIDEVTKVGRYSSPNCDLLNFASTGTRRGQVAKTPQSYFHPEPVVSQSTTFVSGASPLTPSTTSPPESDLSNNFHSLKICSDEKPWRLQRNKIPVQVPLLHRNKRADQVNLMDESLQHSSTPSPPSRSPEKDDKETSNGRLSLGAKVQEIKS